MRKVVVCVLLIWYLLMFPGQCFAAQTVPEPDFSGVDEMLADEGSDLSLKWLFQKYTAGEFQPDLKTIGNWLTGQFFQTLIEWKQQSSRLIFILVAFVFLRGLSQIFEKPELSDFCFLSVYVLFLYQILLMANEMQTLAQGCMEKMSQFLLLVQPLLCLVMVFASGVTTMNLTYEMVALVLYLISHLMQLFVPVIFLYLLIEFANYVWTKAYFSKLARLFRKGIVLAQKLIVGAVFAVNLIQGMIAPSVDAVRRNSVVRTMGVLPGVGGAIHSVGELALGTGLMIKNCVGVCVIAGLLVLFAGPLLELGLLALFYQFLAALVQPLTDKRVCGMLEALSNAGILYFLVSLTSILLVFVTVAILCVMSGAGG